MGTQATHQIGQTIYALLKERGLTQQSLAENLGISKQVMNKIINGKKVMNVNELAQIAQVLRFSTDALLADLVSPPASNTPVFASKGVAVSDEDKETLEVLRTIIGEIRLLEGLLDE
ncbi:MAG: helix-turn-helix transcriptional regulator [Sphaerochaeta sp.]|jgi:transcriptional regulator with XRE-family HTH domain|nr:helix-turn-helix transcriptional regulator [Sphaerochaeta sp.]